MIAVVVSVLEVVQVISVTGLEERYAWLKQDAELILWRRTGIVYRFPYFSPVNGLPVLISVS